jgi:DNA-binding transcriptional LysR family regulator
MTARLKAIEERYQTRLFHRSTRSITLTRAGEEFYHAALRVLEEVHHAESLLTQKEGVLSGNIRLSAPSDFGRQYLSPAVVEFSRRHPDVKFFISLREHVEDLVANRLDMSVRFGNLPDSSLVVRNIRPNHRVLVASGEYLNERGIPATFADLAQHRCLALESQGVVMNEWRFEKDGEESVVRVEPAMVCDDGALLRQWALSGLASRGNRGGTSKTMLKPEGSRYCLPTASPALADTIAKMSACSLFTPSANCSRFRSRRLASFFSTG